jgi:hypothetical protein
MLRGRKTIVKDKVGRETEKERDTERERRRDRHR